jgi:hypothetical protein
MRTLRWVRRSHRENKTEAPSRPSCCYAIEMERRCWYDYPLRHQALGSRAFLADRVELEGCEARDACLSARDASLSASAEGRDANGGFEIEIILQEKSNVFAFPIEDAQDLDFFDQPKLSPEEIAEGTVRPENVIGSYAVYPKAETNHRVGDTLYSTGNACHIYRLGLSAGILERVRRGMAGYTGRSVN